MNFITAILLLFMSEEEAFWTLDTIIEKYLSDYFAASMIGMKVLTSSLSPSCSRSTLSSFCLPSSYTSLAG
jgi:hypothetical protein